MSRIPGRGVGFVISLLIELAFCLEESGPAPVDWGHVPLERKPVFVEGDGSQRFIHVSVFTRVVGTP